MVKIMLSLLVISTTLLAQSNVIIDRKELKELYDNALMWTYFTQDFKRKFSSSVTDTVTDGTINLVYSITYNESSKVCFTDTIKIKTKTEKLPCSNIELAYKVGIPMFVVGVLSGVFGYKYKLIPIAELYK